jgi:hypothetical protein
MGLGAAAQGVGLGDLARHQQQQEQQQQQGLMQLQPMGGDEGCAAGSLITVMADALKLVKELQEKARSRKVSGYGMLSLQVQHLRVGVSLALWVFKTSGVQERGVR